MSSNKIKYQVQAELFILLGVLICIGAVFWFFARGLIYIYTLNIMVFSSIAIISLGWLVSCILRKKKIISAVVIFIAAVLLFIFPVISFVLLLITAAWLIYCFPANIDKKFPIVAASFALMLVLITTGGIIADIIVGSNGTDNTGDSGIFNALPWLTSNNSTGGGEANPFMSGNGFPEMGNAQNNTARSSQESDSESMYKLSSGVSSFSDDVTNLLGLTWKEAWEMLGEGSVARTISFGDIIYGDDITEFLKSIQHPEIFNGSLKISISFLNSMEDVLTFRVNSIIIDDNSPVMFNGLVVGDLVGDSIINADEKLVSRGADYVGGLNWLIVIDGVSYQLSSFTEDDKTLSTIKLSYTGQLMEQWATGAELDNYYTGAWLDNDYFYEEDWRDLEPYWGR